MNTNVTSVSLDEALIGRMLHTPVSRGELFHSSTPLLQARAPSLLTRAWALPEARAAEEAAARRLRSTC